MEVKLGAPQHCPACGHSNPSGRELPRDCMWCGSTGEQGRIKEMFKKMTPLDEKISAVANEKNAVAWQMEERMAKTDERISVIASKMDYVMRELESRMDFAEERLNNLECHPSRNKMFNKGLKAAQRQNKSGCACRFDKDDNIIELCKAHADYFKKMR